MSPARYPAAETPGPEKTGKKIPPGHGISHPEAQKKVLTI
jgi:hypothetical protein